VSWASSAAEAFGVRVPALEVTRFVAEIERAGTALIVSTYVDDFHEKLDRVF
jgi:hypothetical protein